MAERYQIITHSENRMYQANCPVICCAYNILFDNLTEELSLQAKFENLSESTVSEITLLVDCFDTANNLLHHNFEINYIGLNAGYRVNFGSDTVKPLPDKKTRKITLKMHSVIFADGTVWDSTDNNAMTTLPPQQDIADFLQSPELIKEFELLTPNIRKPRKKPIFAYGYWLCSCGEINLDKTAVCYECGCERVHITNLSVKEFIEKSVTGRKEKEQKEFEESQRLTYNKAIELFNKKNYKKAKAEFLKCVDWKDAKEYVEKCEKATIEDKKKRRKILKRIAFGSIFLVIVAIIIVQFLIPKANYNKAIALIEKEQYDEAYEILRAGEYKDSDEIIKQAQYTRAMNLANRDNKFEESINILIELEDYPEEIREIRYMWAKACKDEEDWENAAKQIGIVSSYFEDGPQLKKEIYYEYGRSLMSKKDYENAISYLKDFNYLDSTELCMEARYQYAKQLINKNDYEEAINQIKKIKEYSDASELLKEAKYGYIKKYKSNTDTKTYEYLKELKEIGYKDTAQIYSDLYKWKLTERYFNNSANSTYKASQLSIFDTWYFHYKIEGGTPGEKVKLKYYVVAPASSGSRSSVSEDSYPSGASGWISWGYTGATGRYAGVYSVTVSTATGINLGTYTVPIGY